MPRTVRSTTQHEDLVFLASPTPCTHSGNTSCLLSMYYVPGRRCARCFPEPDKGHTTVPLFPLQRKKLVHRRGGHKPGRSGAEMKTGVNPIGSLCSYHQPCLLLEPEQPLLSRLPPAHLPSTLVGTAPFFLSHFPFGGALNSSRLSHEVSMRERSLIHSRVRGRRQESEIHIRG